MPARIIARANAARTIVQDYRPLGDSIEWELGQGFYHFRGNQAFINDKDPVPFTVNNDGVASYNAADVFHASLIASPPPPGRIFVLEIGMGIGLFARFFLDRIRELSLRDGKDFYARLSYIAADGSEQMLLDACRHGIFSDHAGHYLLRSVMVPHTLPALLADPALAGKGERPFRAIFFNYMLDCLPAAIFKFVERAAPDRPAATDAGPDVDVQSLHLRTCLARNLKLEEHTPLSLQDIRRLAESTDPIERRRLTPLFDLFTIEYDFRSIDPRTVPFGEIAVEVGRAQGSYCIHNYGAFTILAHLAEKLETGGFILINDYGYGPDDPGAQTGYAYQTFSSSTALGLNFPLLGVVCEYLGLVAHQSDRTMDEYFTRMIGCDLPAATIASFMTVFGEAASRFANVPIERVDQMCKTECTEAEADAYLEALRRTPHNWTYLHCAAGFLLKRHDDAANALTMARAALALNPNCSADLWDVAGEALVALERPAEARAAFERALRINRNDLRALYQLAKLDMAGQNHARALSRIAIALGSKSSKASLYDFITLQTKVVEHLNDQWGGVEHRLINRAGKATVPPPAIRGKHHG